MNFYFKKKKKKERKKILFCRVAARAIWLVDSTAGTARLGAQEKVCMPCHNSQISCTVPFQAWS